MKKGRTRRAGRTRGAGAVSLALAGALVLGGCGSTDISLAESAEKIELEVSWWGSDERNSYTMEALKEYDEAHPELDIAMTYGEFTGFEQKNDVKMFAHTEADIMQIDFKWLDKYESQGLSFYDLSQLSDYIDLGQYDETELSYGKGASGAQAALPIAINAKVCWFNKSIYDSYGLDLPKTWDDLFAAAKVMNPDGVYPLDIDSNALWMCGAAYVEQLTGHALFDEDKKFAFTKDEVQQMLEFALRLIDEGVTEQPADRDDQKVGQGIYAGTMQWVSGASKYEQMINERGETVEAVLPPTMENPKRVGWYAKPATLYVISEHTEHPKEAAELLSYLVEGEGMVMRQKLEKGVPCNNKAIEQLDAAGELSGPQYEATVLCEGEEYPLMNPYYELTDYSETVRAALEEVIFGRSDMPTAAAKAYKTMKELHG